MLFIKAMFAKYLVRVTYMFSKRANKKKMIQALIFYAAQRGWPADKAMLSNSVGNNYKLIEDLIMELMKEGKVIAAMTEKSYRNIFLPIERLP